MTLPVTNVADFAPVDKSKARLRKRDPILVIAIVIVITIASLAIVGPMLCKYSPDQVDILAQNQPPSTDHWFGTDALGRDLFTRIVYGARLSLIGPAIVTLVATALGTGLAVLGAWRGGLVDQVLVRVLDVVFAFPALLFGVLAVAVLGSGLLAPVIALSIAYIPYIARLLRSIVLAQRGMPYIEAAQLIGYSGSHVARRHLLPNVRLYVVAQATLTFGYALMDLAAISFIGLGVQPPNSEWGLMINDGASAMLNGYPWQVIAAGSFIVVTVVAFNVIGERLTRMADAR
jgi:peptide/nickel transport system permease protein